MKKIVILSDTHRNASAISSIMNIMRESDLVIHLGDHYDDMNAFTRELGDKLYRVRGNCDAGYGEKELVLTVEDCKILVTHGDLYGVKSTERKLIDRAKELDCDVALYGHTHRAKIFEDRGVTIINPGNMQRYSTDASFCYAVVNRDKITAIINKNVGQ